MASDKKKLGALLVERGYVTAEQVRHALEVQRTKRDRLGNILIELGYLDERRFHEFLSTIEGVASIELARYEIGPDIIQLVPRALALRYEVVPIGRIRDLLTVAMVCPLDQVALEELQFETGMKVKAVLCRRDAVYGALERYYACDKGVKAMRANDEIAPEQWRDLEAAAELVKRIQDLPTLPDIFEAVSAIINDPTSSAADLAKVISTDASLSAKILKLANSPAYGFSRKVVDIKHAIALLGFKETQSLVVSVTVFDYMVNGGEFDFKSYWSHSFACATLAKLLAANLRSHEMESAFVAGLLHDIGKVAVSTDVFAEYSRKHRRGAFSAAFQNDDERLGISHAEVGYLLTEHWLLPPVLGSAIRYHHMPEHAKSGANLAGIIFLANELCQKGVSETAGEGAGDIAQVLQLLGFSHSALTQTLAIYHDIAAEVSVF